ncbi:MAG: UDP-glucose/GDP-mannose dehydrogenase family protein [Phycisphaerales bacterium]|nr:UDP-glucose/GDP-mannose dehydrogenase family protein [Phycisphaerales bacterium]
MADEPTRISILGLGYVGAVSAACFAKLGFEIIGVDIDANKSERLNRGDAPVLEHGLTELVAEQHRAGRIQATTDALAAVLGSDISLVCVGTPSAANGSLNMDYVERVCGQIGEALGQKLSKNEGYHVVVIRSTVLPGTVEERLIPILENASGKRVGVDFGVVQNPEFLREGTAIQDFFHPPKTVIGANDEKSGQFVSRLYEKIDAPLFVTDIGVASVVKYADNAFHAVKITFGNEIGRFCKKLGIDSHEVMQIFCEDRKLNISPAYLRPGFAFGGSCLPKDLRALLYRGRNLDLEFPFLSGLLPSNKLQIETLVEELKPYRHDGVGFLGLSFKPGTDDLRESPIVSVAEALLGKGAEVRIHDPNLVISALVGSNLRYIMSEIPHLGNLLKESPEPVIRASQAIVVSHNTELFQRAVLQTRPDQIVFDLVRLPNAEQIPARYVGLYW